MTDVSFAKGTDIAYEDDDLKITATPLTIADTGAVVEIPDTGLELTSGSGTIAMTALDSAYFKVAAAHGGISEIDVGASSSEFVEHGQYLLAQKRSNGDLFEIQAYRVLAGGIPISLEETTFAIPELTAKMLWDEVENKVYTIRAIKGA